MRATVFVAFFAAALAGLTPGCRKKEGASAAAPRIAPIAAAPPAPPPSPYRLPSADEITAAKAAGFPVDFASCQKTAGARSSVWSCGYKHQTHLAHDPAIRPCAPLVGHGSDEEPAISACALIYWDPTVKLPTDWKDCKDRFVDEPGVNHAKGQELCVVFVGLTDQALFEECRKRPFSEYREGYCKYPLAGPNWSPKGKSLAGSDEGEGASHAGHAH